MSHQKDRKPGDTALMNINLNSQTLTNSLNAPVSVQQRPKAETDRDGCAWERVLSSPVLSQGFSGLTEADLSVVLVRL